MEAIALGIRAVLVQPRAIAEAKIDAAAGLLEAVGVDRRRFREAAQTRLERTGSRALISRACRDLGLGLPTALVRRAACAAAAAVPRLETHHNLVQTLRFLASGTRLFVVDRGPLVGLGAMLESLGLTALFERVVCTEQFGRIARPPRPFAFRWLAQRLDLPAGECLYVSGDNDLHQAAWGAGWLALRAAGVGDLEWLVSRLEGGAANERSATDNHGYWALAPSRDVPDRSGG